MNESWSDILSNITSGNYTLSSMAQDSFESENSSCPSCLLINSLLCVSVDIDSSVSVYETAVSFCDTSGSSHEISDSVCDTSVSKTDSFGLTSSSSFLDHAFCLSEDNVGLVEAVKSSNELVLKDILKDAMSSLSLTQLLAVNVLSGSVLYDMSCDGDLEDAISSMNPLQSLAVAVQLSYVNIKALPDIVDIDFINRNTMPKN